MYDLGCKQARRKKEKKLILTLIQVNPFLIKLKVLLHIVPKHELWRDIRDIGNKPVEAVCIFLCHSVVVDRRGDR